MINTKTTERHGGGVAQLLMLAAVVLVLIIGLLGPSAAQAKLPGGPAWIPPYHFTAHPGPMLVTLVLMAAMVIGGVGLLLAMRALDLGWRPDVRRLTWAGSVGTVLMILVPPMGSTDVLMYAGYGRLATTGRNPYVDVVRDLIDSGDPIGLATVGIRWVTTTSVYGPVMTWLQTAASWIGGSSVHTTVFVITLAGAVAYLITGVLLRRLAGDDQLKQARVALLWTANPVLLFIAVNSGHADTIGIVFAVAALLTLSRQRWIPTGVLVGLACAVKITFGLYVLALILVLYRLPRRLASVLISGLVVGAACYAIVGPQAIHSTLLAGSKYASASPLRWPLYPLSALIGLDTGATVIVIVGWLLLFVFAALLYRTIRPDRTPASDPQRPDGDLLARVLPIVVVLNVGWVLTSAYALPWYDVAAWAPLTLLLGAGLIDRVLLIRTAVLVCAYLPGAAYAFPPATELLTDVARNVVGPAVSLILMGVVVWRAVRRPAARDRSALLR
ncbi:MAG TPA: glycosyltransferase 87 family protein [Microlunatus sp.]